MELEKLPLAEIKKYQEKRLQEAITYLAAHSPFYQRLFAENKIDAQRIRTMEDLRVVPFTVKKDLQLFNDDFYCVPKDRIVDYITTSGTLSTPVTFAMTDKDLDRLAYNEELSFSCGGVKKGDVLQLMTTLDKRFMAGLAYFLGIRRLGAGIIRVGNGIPELQWDTIQRIKPDSIICVPSFILRIIEYAEKNGIDYRNSSVRRAYCIGENLREQDFSLNLLSQQIKEKWDLELYSTYASTEMATTFCECPQGCGGHHHPELIICELVDDEGNNVPEGEAGELTITTLGVEGMPLLRFRTGDMARFHYEPCACGRTTMRISPILGRKNHMIKYKGTTLYPPSINDVLDHSAYVEMYQIVLSDSSIGTDNVTVRISLTPMAREQEEDEIVKLLKDSFRAKIRVAPDIEVMPSDELRPFVFPQISRKPVKIIDQRKK